MTSLPTKPKPGAVLNPLHHLSRDLVICWMMNEGTGVKLYDLSGKNNHGTLANFEINNQGSGWTGSNRGGALFFNGTNDIITVPDNNYVSGLRAITCSCWIYSTNWGGGGQYPFIIAKSNYTNNREYRIRLESNTRLVWHISNNGQDPGGAEVNIPISGNLFHGKWHHLVGTYDTDDSNLLKLYIDGVLKGTYTGETGPIYNSSSDFSVGSSGDNNSAASFYGIIDMVRIYNRAISASEALQLYQTPFVDIITPSILRLYTPAAEPDAEPKPTIPNDTKPKPGATIDILNPINNGLVGCWLFNEGNGSSLYDISGKNNHGTLKNMSTNDQLSGWGGSLFGGGLSFDGTNDYVDCGNDPSLSMTDVITVSAWIKTNSLTSYQDIFHNGVHSVQNKGMYFGLDNTGKYGLYLGNGTTSVNALSTVGITAGWYHLSATWDGTTIKLYKNGVQDPTTYLFSGPIVYDPGNISLGRATWGGYYFDGIIDSLRLYNSALNTNEIQKIYENPFVGIITQNTKFYYYIEEVGIGWIGIINGVTNPAKIYGIPVANIVKVSGVE